MNGPSWMERVQALFKSLPPGVRRRLNQDAQRAPDKGYVPASPKGKKGPPYVLTQFGS
jgi:hypothetical protein